jgi:hypothetical protein
MRLILGFLLLLATLPLAAQDVTQRVSFSTPATPLARALDQLSKQTGVHLAVAPTLANQTLFVHVEDAPLSELMNRIAKVMNGEWRPEGEGFRLGVATAARRQEERAEQEARLKAVQERVKALAEEAAKPREGAQPPGGFMPSFSPPAASAAIARLLQTIDLTLIASLPEEGRIVFATNPTPSQRPLPQSIGPIIDTLIKEHNASAVKAPPVDAQQEQMIPDFMRAMMRNMRPTTITTPPAKVALVATRSSFMESLRVDLLLYDAKGQVLFNGSQDIGIDFEGLMRMIPGQAQEEEPAEGDKTPIELSPETKEIQTFFGSMMQPNAQAKISPEVRAKLLRPDLHDPLSFFHSDSLRGIAKARKMNVVAHIPDTVIEFGGMFAPASATVGAAMKAFSEGETTLAEEEGWILVTPSAPMEARRKHVDRRALAALIAAAEAKGTASLDDIASYALTNNSPMETPAAMSYVMLFAPTAMGFSMSGMTNWQALRLYGALNQQQRQTLAQGGRIPLNALGPAAGAAARELLFGASTGLTVERAEDTPGEDSLPAFIRVPMARFMGGQQSSILQEPTQVMPSGLPATGYLTASIASETVARPIGSDRFSPAAMMGVLGAEDLAMFRFMREDPTMSQFAGEFLPQVDKVQLGTRQIITLRFQVAPNVYQEETLQDNRVDLNAPVVAMNSLPAEFAKRIEARLERFKKEGFFGLNPGMMGGMGGRGRPPQP